jgi:aryl-alcohol dehydrogenase-like predicted oxidoreductase
VKKIVLGTAQFSGNYGVTRKNSFLTKNEAHKILKTLLTKKLRHLDTSIDYENSLKKINSFNFNNWQITTKMDPKKLDFSSEQNLYLSVENQIKLIKQNSSIKTIKNLLIRNSDMILTTKGKILYKVLKKIKKNKLIINFGYSIYSFKNLEKIIINFKPDLIQCPYNVFDRRIENIKIKNILKKKKIKVQARSIFLQGVLLKKIDQLPKFFHKWKKLFLNFENSIKINKLTALSLCFNFVNNNKDIDEILIGVQNNKELKEILNIELKRKILMSKELFNPSLKLIDPTKW